MKHAPEDVNASLDPTAQLLALTRCVEGLQEQLEEANATIEAIRGGEVDAFVVTRGEQSEVLTLDTDRIWMIADAVPALIGVIDRECCYRFVNRQYESWFDCQRSDILGTPVESVLGKEAYERILPALKLSFTGRESTYEGWLPYRTGQRYVRARYIPERDSFGRVHGCFVLVVDGTEKKVAAQGLEQANARTARILESIRESFFQLDGDLRITYTNPQAAAHFGWPSEQLLHRLFTREISPFAEENLEDQLRLARERNVSVQLQSRGAHDPDQWFELRIYPSVEGLSIFFRDVSEHKRSEEERERLLQRERALAERLQSLAAVSLEITASHDSHEALCIATEQARSLIGTHQAIGYLSVDGNDSQAGYAVSLSEKYASFRDLEIRPEASGLDHEVCHNNRPLRLTHLELLGHPLWKYHQEKQPQLPLRGWLAVPLVSRSGRNLGILKLSDKYEGDFNEDDEAILVQLAQMVSRAVENTSLYSELKLKDRRKDEFLAMLAHELRNPLAAVINSLAVARIPDADEESRRWASEVMERQLGQLTRLIDDLMDVSRITRGKIQLRNDPVNLEEVLQRAIQAVSPMIDSRRHFLSQQITHRGQLWTQGDAARLEQVFVNLLSNAAKFTPTGGRISVILALDGDQIVACVEDTGIGMEAETVPLVFELFSQAHPGHDRAHGGLGIGLTLVQRLVEMHRGSVTGESEGEGRGSKFTVRLPAIAAPDQIHMESQRPTVSKPKSRKVLVVDDNRDATRALGMLLEGYGFQTKLAFSAQEALNALDEFQADIALLDIGLPGMDGYALARAIRARSTDSVPLLVAVSGYGQQEDRRRSAAAGFDHHLVKPVDHQDLVTLLNEA